MKFLHIADLHLGKKLRETSLLEDQKEILEQIIGVVDAEKPDAVLVAGDVYDKYPAPSSAAKLFECFLYDLADCGTEVFVISGNHDNADYLSHCNRFLEPSKIHIASPYGGDVEPITIKDEFGPVNVYMLPFVRPTTVRQIFPEESISDYNDAARVAVERMRVDKDARNVLVAHQHVTGAEISEDEFTGVGDLGPVDPSVFDAFDYVALGHIHGSQNIGPRIRYCGSPLKYSESEARRKGKSVTIAEMDETGGVSVREVPLKPVRDVVELKGKFAELTDREYYDGKPFLNDYVYVTLTDDDPVPNAGVELRKIYKNFVHIGYDNSRMRAARETGSPASGDVEEKSPMEFAAALFEDVNGTPMTDKQREFLEELIDETWRDENEAD